jgi:integrase
LAIRRPARLAQNRHGVFSLRWVVPLRFRNAQGKPKEVRVSLRTRDVHRARILAMEINLAYEKALQMSSNFDPRTLLTPWSLSVGDLKVDVKDEADLASFNAFLEQHPDIKQAMLKKIEQGMAPDQVAAQFQQLLAGKPAPVASALLGALPHLGGPGAAAAPGITPVKLTEAVDKFAGTRASFAKSKRSTVTEKRRTLDLLMAYLERANFDLSKTLVHELGRAQFLDFVHDYSSRAGKSTADPDAPNKGGRPPKSTSGLGARTVVKAIGHLKEFCTYATAHQMMAVSPLDAAFDAALAGLRMRVSSARKHNGYKAFNQAELDRIFDPVSLLEGNASADYFWAPILGLFTGARLGELVTRTVDDFRIDPASGLLVMDIVTMNGRTTDDSSGERGPKNENSRRTVPIAQALLDIGLGRYVDHVRSLGGVRLFPHLKDGSTRDEDPSKNQSRHFTAYLTKLGLKNDDLVFHSFRHTVLTVLHVRKVPLKDAELIAGHAAQEEFMRLENATGSARSGWNATQPNTYIHADMFENDGQALMARLKDHLDRALTFKLDYPGLACAAEIVRKHLTRAREGDRDVFTSGWHTNAKAYTNKMLAELQGAREAAGGIAKADGAPRLNAGPAA